MLFFEPKRVHQLVCASQKGQKPLDKSCSADFFSFYCNELFFMLQVLRETIPCRKRKEWDVYEPFVDLLSNEEVEALKAREERNIR